MKALIWSSLFWLSASASFASLTGEVLALKHAYREYDENAIEDYVDRVLEEMPDEPELLNGALLAAVYNQDLEKALSYVPKAREIGLGNYTTDFVELAYAIRTLDFEGLEGSSDVFEFLDKDIINAWSLAIEGDVEGAKAVLEHAKEAEPKLALVFTYQLAMISATIEKDYETALSLLENDGTPLLMSNISRPAIEALRVLSGVEAGAPMDDYLAPWEMRVILEDARAGKVNGVLPFASPQAALTEYLAFIFGESIRNDGDGRGETERFFVTLLASIDPENAFYRSRLLEFYNAKGEAEEVVRLASGIDYGSAFGLERRFFELQAHIELDDEVAARAVLDREGYGFLFDRWRANSWLRFDEYEKAMAAADAVFARDDLDEALREDLYFVAGIAANGMDDWPQATEYFDLAIAQNPEDAQLLNWYGYSLVDRGERVEEGLEMIEAAIAISANSPNILDSLGWAYYKLGRYQDALSPLELAASELAYDPVVNSHLGDVYWVLGRKREARYQWERALDNLDEDLPDITKAELETRLASGLPESQ